MAKLIQQSYANVPEGWDIGDNKYDLIGPDGEIILQSLWESLVQPGWEITMKKWEQKIPPKAPIKFKDALGRKFSFPFHLCKTWVVSFLLISPPRHVSHVAYLGYGGTYQASFHGYWGEYQRAHS